MAKLSIIAGATSQSLNIFIQDSTSTTGAGKTGLVFNTSSLTAYYSFAGANAASVAISLVTLAAANSAWTSGGFKEIDATNLPGFYRFDPPNAAIAASKGRSVAFMFQGATGMAPLPLEIELVAIDSQDGVRMGMTALPNALPGAVNGIFIVGANTGGVSISGGLTVTSSTGDALTVTSNFSGGNAINLTGNGAGAGLLVNAGATGKGVSILTTAGDGFSVTPTGGHALVLTGNGTSKHGFFVTGGTAGTSDGIKAVAGTGGVDVRGNITGSITGSLSGSAGSVTSGVTVTTNNDKTGYSLSQAFPTNFSSLSISVGGKAAATIATGDITDISATRAAKIDNADVATSTRLAASGYTAPTNLTATQIATGVWQDATPGDFTTAGSIGKSLFTSGVVPGAAGGLFIAGSNAATTVNITGNLSGTVGSVTGAVGSVTGSVGSCTATVTADLVNAPNATAITAFANGLLDLANAIDPGGTDTLRKAIRIGLAALAGKASGAAGTTITFRDTADTKDRVVATVDTSGNRTAVTLTGT